MSLSEGGKGSEQLEGPGSGELCIECFRNPEEDLNGMGGGSNLVKK